MCVRAAEQGAGCSWLMLPAEETACMPQPCPPHWRTGPAAQWQGRGGRHAAGRWHGKVATTHLAPGGHRATSVLPFRLGGGRDTRANKHAAPRPPPPVSATYRQRELGSISTPTHTDPCPLTAAPHQAAPDAGVVHAAQAAVQEGDGQQRGKHDLRAAHHLGDGRVDEDEAGVEEHGRDHVEEGGASQQRRGAEAHEGRGGGGGLGRRGEVGEDNLNVVAAGEVVGWRRLGEGMVDDLLHACGCVDRWRGCGRGGTEPVSD